MPHAKTVVQIVDKSLDKVSEVKNLYPINNKGDVLRYSRELSDWGKCTFRISTKDPLFEDLGDIIKPHVYGIRIVRGGTTVWSGAIVDNPSRTKNYIEIEALEYEFYLSRVNIHRDAETTPGDGLDNYRTFSSGSMAAAAVALILNAIDDFGTNHPLGSMTLGTVENPDYPQGFADESGVALTGEWFFTDFVSLQFDYHSVYYALKAFGIYADCDFEVDENLIFNFQKFIGSKTNRLTFEYGPQGNIVDYNLPRLGKRMINNLWGIAADTDGKILHANQEDSESRNTYGLLQDSAAYSDVKDLNFLRTRMAQELQFTKTPEDAPVNVLVDEKAYPLGQYDLGDIITVKIKDHIIDFNAPRRIVGITTTVHNTGRELTAIQTNKPRDKDLS